MLTEHQLQALGLDRTELTAATVLDMPDDLTGDMLSLRSFLEHEPAARGEFRLVDSLAAYWISLKVEQSMVSSNILRVSQLPENSWEVITSGESETAVRVEQLDGAALYVDLLAGQGVLLRMPSSEGIVIGPEPPWTLEYVSGSEIRFLTPPAIEAPLRELSDACPDHWLAKELQTRLQIDHSWEHVVAMGMYRRLLSPPQGQDLQVTAEALLLGEPSEFWASLDRPSLWIRSLSPEELNKIQSLTETAIEFLEFDLRELQEDIRSNQAPRREKQSLKGLLRLCHDRDDVEGVQLLLSEVGKAQSLEAALEPIDRVGRTFMKELTERAGLASAEQGDALEPQAGDVRFPLQLPVDDERLSRVLLRDPDAWWAQLAGDPETSQDFSPKLLVDRATELCVRAESLIAEGRFGPALRRASESIELWDQIAARWGESWASLVDRSLAQCIAGDAHRKLHQFEAAEQQYQEAVEAFRSAVAVALEPAGRLKLAYVALALGRLGRVRQQTGRFQAALECFHEARLLYYQLIAEFSDDKDVTWLDELAWTLERTAETQHELGDIEREVECYAEAVKYLKQFIADEEKQDPSRFHHLVYLLEVLGDAQYAYGAFHEAEERFDEARDILLQSLPYTVDAAETRALAEKGDRARAQETKQDVSRRLLALRRHLAQKSGNLESLREIRSILLSLVSIASSVERQWCDAKFRDLLELFYGFKNWADDSAETLHLLADTLSFIGIMQQRAAKNSFGEAVELLQRLQTEQPAHSDDQRAIRLSDLSSAFTHLADLESGAGKFGNAVEHYTEALACLREIRAKDPATPDYWLNIIEEVLAKMADLEFAAGDIREAEGHYAEALRCLEEIQQRGSVDPRLADKLSIVSRKLDVLREALSDIDRTL